MKKLRRNILPLIITLAALSVSGSAAFYSVSGLSKLFAGASTEVIIMAGSLEVAKLVIASLLYQYWGTLNKWLRAYLSIATVILVLITSMGIYGFLSAAYQQTYAGLSVVENKIEFLEQKKNFYENDVTRFDQELKGISTNINNLSTAKSSQIQVRDTSSTSGFRTTISTTELRMAQKRIDTEEVNRKSIQSKREVAADSLQKYQLQILNLNTQSSTSGELGPLKYLAGLTGIPMDRIINYLLLTIIFVFDPLAISLVIAANFAFNQAKPKKTLYGEDEDIEDIGKGIKKAVDSYDDLQSETQDWNTTLNDGLENNEEWKITDENDNELPEKKTIKRVIQKSPKNRRVEFTDGTVGWVSKTELKQDQDEHKITYL
jgi:hypothetical protein